MPKKKRRARGEGAIRYIKASKLWEGSLNLGTDPQTGRRCREYVYGSSQEECSAKLTLLRAEKLRGQSVKISKSVLSTWLDQWFELYCKPFISANTAAKHHGNIHRIKAGPLSNQALVDIDRAKVQRWAISLSETYAEATVRTTLSTLTQAFEELVEERRIAFNPAKGIRVPTKARKAIKARAMDEKVLAAFLKQLSGNPYEVPILFLLNTGLRSGELCALDIRDYKQRIRIERTWSKALNAVQDQPKTESSKRTIPKPAALEPVMTLYMFTLPRKEPTSPLFQTTVHRRGLRLRPDYLDALIKEIGATIGEPWISPHTLRHTYASTLFRTGVKIKVVSELLGHKDVSTTYDIYIHLIPEELDESTRTIGDSLIGGV
jgi:integrase